MYAQSLKQILFDALKVSKHPLSLRELVELGEENGYKASNVERRLRRETWADTQPVQRLGVDLKPVTGSKRIYYYRWKGARTVLNPEKKIKQKQYA